MKTIHTQKPKKLGLKEITKAVGNYDIGLLSHVFFNIDFFVRGRNKSTSIETTLQGTKKVEKYLRKSLLNKFRHDGGWGRYYNSDLNLKIVYSKEDE